MGTRATGKELTAAVQRVPLVRMRGSRLSFASHSSCSSKGAPTLSSPSVFTCLPPSLLAIPLTWIYDLLIFLLCLAISLLYLHLRTISRLQLHGQRWP